MSLGHVFVVRGAMEHLDCDAVIVSTDFAFSVTARWARVLGVEADSTGHCVAAGSEAGRAPAMRGTLAASR